MLLDQVESLKSLMQCLKGTPTGCATWEKWSSTLMPSWKVHCNSMRTNDGHQGCDTSREPKRTFEPVCKQLTEEELKGPLTYKGNVRKLILEQMSPQTHSLMEWLGLLIVRGTEMSSRDSGEGKTLTMRMMGKWSNGSRMFISKVSLLPFCG